MRFSFEKNMGGFNDVAKDVVEGGLTEKEERNLAGELASKIRRAAAARSSTADAQKEIFFIQEEKQRIFQDLKDKIALLDDPKYAPERKEYEWPVVKKDGSYVVEAMREGGSQATKGELITDMQWGLYYYLDPATVDRNVRKRYLIEEAKQALQVKLDEQITKDELSSGTTSDNLKIAYGKKSESTGEEAGFIAERMVKGFLKKLSFDYGMDFDVLEADAFQDVTQKIDFIIRRKKHERGVRVEAEAERVGIQFTTNTSTEAIEHKKYQVEQARGYLREGDKVEDIVLVSISASDIRALYDEWRSNPRPGGPDKLWDISIKEQIFREVLKEVLTPEEIEADWEKVAA